ncbi:tail fiber domain-containing protein [bacterium]|nr:tail fiber domain-containing protein [bacterium]
MKNNNKLKAFTLAEVMVLLLTLSILMAAFAPVFTRRYSNVSSDDVWTFVPGDDENDAYYDALNKNFTAQAFIGLTPTSKADVIKFSSSGDKVYYSKLVIAASKDLKPTAASTGQPQNQMQFRYGNSKSGDLVGNLFAGNNNILLGGHYGSIKNDAQYNTGFGRYSMNALSTGKYNTAFGNGALADFMSSGSANTAIGAMAGRFVENATGNTIAGAYAGGGKDVGPSANPPKLTGNYNTLIGTHAARRLTSGSYNVAIGDHAMWYDNNGDNITGSYNTAVGSFAQSHMKSGSYNTAVGSNAMKNVTTGSYNTAIGYGSCNDVSTGSYKTCVGAFSGSEKSASEKAKTNLFTGNYERVFIGSIPVQRVESQGPAAVLEVHNINSSGGGYVKPLANVGNSSVVINGNLIVRGQTYLETPLVRPSNICENCGYDGVPKGPVLYTQAPINGGIHVFYGFDGMQRWNASQGSCNGCRWHAYSARRPNCVCTSNAGYTGFDRASYSAVSTSYDWASKTATSNSIYACEEGSPATYWDKSTNNTITLELRDGGQPYGKKGTDEPYAHINLGEGWTATNQSCCPVLTNYSDIRLKNVGQKYTAGLDEIKKLNVYNYTFKTDKYKLPQVGVIAQDLKLIFPNAVVKGEDGYYKIRWDEMFYAAVNAIKTLNTKIENIASKIAKDKQRVAVLKKDNEQLNARLDKLADELTQLEAKRK